MSGTSASGIITSSPVGTRSGGNSRGVLFGGLNLNICGTRSGVVILGEGDAIGAAGSGKDGVNGMISLFFGLSFFL